LNALVFEEHHEAFYFWKEAGLKGLSLVHIDEHSDMDLPTLQKPMLAKNASLDETRAFILRELNIANFIWPAVLDGMLSEVWWHREHETTQPYDGPVSVFTTEPDRRGLAWVKGPLPSSTRSSRTPPSRSTSAWTISRAISRPTARPWPSRSATTSSSATCATRIICCA
jgi:hypothetical protein